MTKAASLTTTVMFADICSSTSLFSRLGDEKAAALINEALHQASMAVTKHEGIVLRTMGDDVLCIFPDPLNALKSALEVHSSARRNTLLSEHEISMRIGINSGLALLSPDDIHGDTVNVAARLATFAKADQTIVSKHTIEMIDNKVIPLTRPLGEFSIKGKIKPLMIFELLDASEQDEITQIGSSTLQFPKVNRLSLRFQSHQADLDYLLTTYLLGRHPDCNLVIDHPLVSRHHAEIRYQNDEFILFDLSTNGTFLSTNGRIRPLHHTSAALRGNGSIFLGRTIYNKTLEITFSASGGSKPFSQTNN